MSEPIVEIPRRVDWVDFAIIVAVIVMVAVDLVLIRDPLHTLLGILMIPAAVRVVRGFHSVAVYHDRIECSWLVGAKTFPLGGTVSVRRRKAVGTHGVLMVQVGGEKCCTVGHTATPDELVELEHALVAGVVVTQ